jgi:hypothetical protein
VHSYLAQWSEPGEDGFSVLERALRDQGDEVRLKLARNAMTSFLVVDAESAKNTDCTEVD